MDVSEHWEVREASLRPEDLLLEAGEGPFALLWGEGVDAEWWILGKRPLLVLDSVPGAGDVLPHFHRTGDCPPVRPDFIGHLTYECGSEWDRLRPVPPPARLPLPAFRFVLYGEVLAYHMPSRRLHTARREGPVPAGDGNNPHIWKRGPFRAALNWSSDTLESYAAKVTRIREAIGRGDVYQVSLTRQEHWAFEGDLRQFARRLYEANPAPYSALLATPEHTIVSSSPECFLRLRDGILTSRPIKGTAPRGATREEDRRLAEALLASAKDRAELAMIVDLVRNDLTGACRVPSVRVESFPCLETWANVHHLVATILGDVRPGLSLRELLEPLFPAGSITGCPKLSAMSHIAALEETTREVYTGAIGWFSSDLSDLCLSVAIRTAWAREGLLAFGTGGGVVWDSDPASEYFETVHKGRSITQCLNS